MGQYKTIFLDVGGVLLTNGWGHELRERAAKAFGLDYVEMEKRHKKVYDLHEVDKITLDEYLQETVFWKPRDFTSAQFIQFMQDETRPFPEMFKLVEELRNQGFSVAIVSNEGRQLTEFRIGKFSLASIAEFFFVSCFVHCQKPDPMIFQIALDVSNTKAEEVIYIDDRAYLVEAAGKMGIAGIVHQDAETTRKKIRSLIESAFPAG